MIKINPVHEQIAEYIVKGVSEDQAHAISQHDTRQYFTDPYRLHEYDLTLRLLKDFDVIRHNDNDRLTPGNSFYTYKSLEYLYKSKLDWKFWLATMIAVFGVSTAFYFNYTDNQKSNKIEKLEKNINVILTSKDSLLERIIYIDSMNKVRQLSKSDSTLK